MPQPTFSVLILTAAPTGLAAEAGGAFVKIDGRESILRATEMFLNRDNVKQIHVVFQPEEAEEGRRKYGGHLGLFGVKVLTGGPRWIDQAMAAAEKINPDCSHVILHDAARPAVPYSDIDALLDAAPTAAATVLATPMRTPLVEVDEGGNPMAFHGATSFMQIQTPMALSLATYREMVTKKAEPHASQFKIVKGSPLNVRIGGPGDATLVRSMINMLPKPKVKGPSNPFEEAQW